jgi:anti-sigma-K factor RskA
LYNLVASGQASQSNVDNYQNWLLQSLQQDMNSGLIGQQQAMSLLGTMESQIATLKVAQAAVTPASSGGSGGVHQYTVNLPGGGQMRVNANSPAAAIGNAGGGTIA